MKRSEFKAQIREEIIDILEAASAEDVQAQKDYNAELEKTAQLVKDAGLAEGNDSDKFQDDGYVQHKYDDDVIDKYNIPVEPTAVFQEAERAADRYNVNVFGYQTRYYRVCPVAKAFMDKVVAGGYGDMSDRKNEVIRMAKLNDLLFKMELRAVEDANYAKKIVTSGEVEYIADTIEDMAENLGIPKADVDYVDNHVEIIFDAQSGIKENEDKEPKAKDLKGEPLSKIGYRLADVQKEMKKVVKKYSATPEGSEKEELKDRLRELNKIKKELESLL